MPVYAGEGNIIQVTLNGILDNQKVMTVLHYIIREVGGSVLLKDVCDGMNDYFGGDDGFYADYLGCLSEDYDAELTYIQRIYSVRQIAYTYPPFASGGGIAHPALPPGVSVALTKRAEGADRHCIGGVRLPAVPVTWNAAGLLDPTSYDPLDRLMDDIKRQVVTATPCTLDPVILNRASPGSSQIVYQVIRQDNLRTMARRVVGRGI